MAISRLKVGDKVRSRNVKTGKDTARTVAQVHVNHDTDLLDLTVSSHGRRAVLHTTANHPFWSSTRHAWVRADLLTTADKLTSDDHNNTDIVGVAATQGDDDRWDLTVNIEHDYYVVGNDAAVLVHNCGDANAAKTADDWPILSGIVRDAAKGKGNFGLGSGTASQAQHAGQSWIGDGFSVASDGKTVISRDGLRQWRPPSYKPNLDKWQSNFESRLVPRGQWQGNGHLDITDLP